jgi:hypothetical protein
MMMMMMMMMMMVIDCSHGFVILVCFTTLSDLLSQHDRVLHRCMWHQLAGYVEMPGNDMPMSGHPRLEPLTYRD